MVFMQPQRLVVPLLQRPYGSPTNAATAITQTHERLVVLSNRSVFSALSPAASTRLCGGDVG